jgi:hypothetical protein
MKKFLIVFIGLTLTINLFGQNEKDTVINNKVSEVTSTVNQVIDGIERISGNVWSALEELAKALEVPAKHVYTVVIKQQIVKSITEVITFVILPLIFLIFWYHLATIKWKLFTEKTMEHTEGWSLSGVLPIIICSCIILFGADWSIIITGFVNPEFGALQDVTEMVKTLTK